MVALRWWLNITVPRWVCAVFKHQWEHQGRGMSWVCRRCRRRLP